MRTQDPQIVEGRWPARRAASLGNLATLLVCIGLFVSHDSLGESTSLETLVKENTYRLSLSNKRLEGPGADWLRREADAAQFVVLGEPHNSTSVPRFTSALFKLLHGELGYDALALEQGPLITTQLGAAAESSGLDGLFALARMNLDALHFRTAEELTMIADVARMAGQRGVWGIDRELAAAHVLREIAASRAGDASTAAADLLDRVNDHNATHFHDTRFMVVNAVELETFGDRWRAIPGRAGTLADVLYRSAHNLALFTQGGDDAREQATLEREELLKNEFRDQLKQFELASNAQTKVMLKLGHQHCRRAESGSEFVTLGAYVESLAAERGGHALFVNIQILNPPGKYWSLTDNADYDLLSSAGSVDAWTLIDLRPLRQTRDAGQIELNETLFHLVSEFDAILLLGGADRGSMRWVRKPRAERR